MNRQLILISNPGNPNDGNYLKVTEDAIDRWERFFRSPIGGYWQDGEILRYDENKPIDTEAFRRLLIPLNTVQCDYSVIVFCGHGACTIDDRDAIQLPIPTQSNINLLAVDELINPGIPTVRRTVILDACRSLIPYTSAQLFEQRAYSSVYTIDGIECSKYYNSQVLQASPHIEVLYSTSEHHKAYGSMTGSKYADAMAELVRKRALYWKALAINNRYGQYCYSMCDLQKELTTDLVSKNVQTPEYRIVGKADAYFPFVAMHLPTDRTLYVDDAVVEIIED